MKVIQTLALASVLAANTPSAQAFTLLYSEGADLTTIGWKQNNITFDIDSSCESFMDDVNASVGKAKDLWNGVPSSGLTVSMGATVTLPSPITTYVGNSATEVAPAGNPIIYCDTSFEANSGLSGGSIPGYASSQNLLTSGQLQGGLLVLNFQSGASANIQTLGADVASIVLAHEIGHVLGLGHSSDVNALMYYSTGSTRKLILAQDDINGISYLYPRQEPSPNGLLGCGTLSMIGASGAGGGSSKPSSKNGAPTPGAIEFCLLLAFAAGASQLLKHRRFEFLTPTRD